MASKQGFVIIATRLEWDADGTEWQIVTFSSGYVKRYRTGYRRRPS